MRQARLIGVALAVTAVLARAEATPCNLLTNGSFEFWSRYAPERLSALRADGAAGEGEDPLLPARWTWDLHRPATLARSTEAHSGSYAARLTVPPGAWPASLSMAYVEVVAGAEYDFGVWAKGAGQVSVQLQGQAVEGLQTVAEAKGVAGPQWTHVRGTAKIPGHIQLVRLAIAVQAGAEVLLDDAQISADLDAPYDADAVLRDRPARDEHTLLWEDFEDAAGLRLEGKAHLTEPGGGRWGRGLRLDQPDLATVPLKLGVMPKEGTLECWLSPDAMPMLVKETWNNIWHFLEVNTAALDLAHLQADTSQCLRWSWRTGEELYGRQNSVCADSSVSLGRMRRGQWTHVAVEWDPGAVRLYVDGVLAAVQTDPPVGWAAPVNITFGSSYGN